MGREAAVYRPSAASGALISGRVADHMSKPLIRVGHSPDSDDAFMFWALATGKVESSFEFEHILRDIQTLNDWALEGRLETTAVSVHAFAHVADKYALLRHGGSFGEGYGPMLVSNRPMHKPDLRDVTIAVPGTLTSAYLQLRLYYPDAKPEVMPFDEIMPAVKSGRFDVGLIIHEGQLTWEQEGLHLVEDFGLWWRELTGLPLPLGVNVVRKDLGNDAIGELNRVMKESIRLGLENRQEALQYALQFARGLDLETSDQFVGMYVNERTLDMGQEGQMAIKRLLEMGAQAGIVPAVEVEVV
ncbi:MAG: 1,4-dihydroxy-6-naphtoate synthase [Fimbriimonadales bacterium]|nr:1,4-dihydroxy-6-naphtoate synthase [Fimbriimonadales bacterium]